MRDPGQSSFKYEVRRRLESELSALTWTFCCAWHPLAGTGNICSCARGACGSARRT